jgi:hypothetical protein
MRKTSSEGLKLVHQKCEVAVGWTRSSLDLLASLVLLTSQVAQRTSSQMGTAVLRMSPNRCLQKEINPLNAELNPICQLLA